MQEASKAIMRRSYDQRFATRYFVGEGIDIGCGNDCIGQYTDLFPRMGRVRPWDIDDGDAEFMPGVPDATYDFVHSSHCLEHLHNPVMALGHWIRICKPGGHLILMVPDEDLYEQGVWPSTYNPDHKWSFTIGKRESWNPRSINVTELLGKYLQHISVLRIELLDMSFRYDVERRDQTVEPLGECAIEIVLRRRTADEIVRQGRFTP